MTARVNILRVLRMIGFDWAFFNIEAHDDRIYATSLLTFEGLREQFKRHGWHKDPGEPKLHPGAFESWREGEAVRPALQICFLRDGRVEIDLDFAAPRGDLLSVMVHGFEVLWNWVRRKKTDQRAMARALDRRFGKEAAQHA